MRSAHQLHPHQNAITKQDRQRNAACESDLAVQSDGHQYFDKRFFRSLARCHRGRLHVCCDCEEDGFGGGIARTCCSCQDLPSHLHSKHNVFDGRSPVASFLPPVALLQKGYSFCGD